MATDRQKLMEVFSDLHIGFDIEPRTDEPGTLVQIRAKETQGAVGYSGFVAEFYFDADEDFVEVGIWE